MATGKRTIGKRPKGVSSSTVEAGRHRPRASIACINCRQRKVRCDVQKVRPGVSCSQCRTMEQECIVFHLDDRRRYGSHHHIAALRDRLQSIETLMRDNLHKLNLGAVEQSLPSNKHPNSSISPQAVYSIAESPSLYTPSSLRSSPQACAESAGPSTPATDTCDVKADLSIPATEPIWSSWSTRVDRMSTRDQPSPLSNNGLTKTSICYPDNETSRLESQESAVQSAIDNPLPTPPDDDQSPSQDANSSIGQFRFCQSLGKLPMKSLPTDGNIDLGTVVNPDSSQVRKLLLDTGWRYFALQANVVHEEYFLSHQKMGIKSDHYSPFLENTLLGCASRISTSAAVRKLGRVYIDRATQDIPSELEYPTQATLRGFLLLADFEASQGRDRLGWTYMGIACRLLYDLGLPMDHQLVDCDDATACHIWARCAALVSTFVYDTLWSMHLGRPRTLPLPMMSSAWTSIQSCVDNQLLRIWMDLSIHIAQISDILNTYTSLDMGAVAQLLDIDSRLQHVHKALPPDFAYRNASIAELDAAAYAYNMQFHSIKIVIHRALARFLVSEGPSLSENGDLTAGTFPYNPNFSWVTMYESAMCITELTVTYCEIFGFDRILTVMLHNIYMAAITLINHALVLQHCSSPIENDIRGIRLLVDILAQTQVNFPIATRMCKALSQTICGTSLAPLLDCSTLALEQTGSTHQTNASSCPPTPWGAMGAFTNHPILESPTQSDVMFDRQNQPFMSEIDVLHQPFFVEPMP